MDLSLFVLERYLEELNSRYGSIFKELDKEMDEKDLVVEKIRLDIKNVFYSKDVMVCNDILLYFRFSVVCFK